MSYLQGRSNIFSLVSKTIINYIKDNHTENNNIKTVTGKNEIQLKSINQAGKLSDKIFLGTPNNLTASTNISINCGNEDKCLKCLNDAGISDSMLDKDNYNKNIQEINKIRNNECFGVCSCKFTNINLSSTLLFTTGININSEDINTSEIINNIKSSLTKLSQKSSTSSQTNWVPIILGAAGGITGEVVKEAAGYDNTTIFNNIDSELQNIVNNISTIYTNSINQLISSSQEMIVKGTGIKVHNVSIKSLQDITMSASQQNCGKEGSCIIDNVNSITNSLMRALQSKISSEISGMFEYAFQQNKSLIIAGGIFIATTMILYFVLLFKRSTKT